MERSFGNHARTVDQADLIRTWIDAGTYHQIRRLNVECRGLDVRISGQARSYHLKQLATQAVRSALPDVQVDNCIAVGAT